VEGRKRTLGLSLRFHPTPLGACLVPDRPEQAATSTNAVLKKTRRTAIRPLTKVESEESDGEVGIDVVLAHEGDQLAIERAFHDSYELVTMMSWAQHAKPALPERGREASLAGDAPGLPPRAPPRDRVSVTSRPTDG
jgi:hypothetical protein